MRVHSDPSSAYLFANIPKVIESYGFESSICHQQKHQFPQALSWRDILLARSKAATMRTCLSPLVLMAKYGL